MCNLLWCHGFRKLGGRHVPGDSVQETPSAQIRHDPRCTMTPFCPVQKYWRDAGGAPPGPGRLPGRARPVRLFPGGAAAAAGAAAAWPPTRSQVWARVGGRGLEAQRKATSWRRTTGHGVET